MMEFHGILKELGFEEKYFPKIMNYISNYNLHMSEYYNLNQIVESPYRLPHEPDIDLLPLNLHILSKVKDLSKVHFISTPVSHFGDEIIQIQTKAFSTTLSHFDLMDLRHIYKTTDPKIIIREYGIEKFRDIVSDDINKHIDEGNEVIIYQVVSRYSIIAEQTMLPKITVYSRINYKEKENGMTLNDL